MCLKEVVCPIRKTTLLFERLFEENAEAWISKANIYHLLQLIIIGKNNKALIVKWLHSFALISETLMLHQFFTIFPDVSDPPLFVASNSHLPSREMWCEELWVLLREGHLTWLSLANSAISLNDLYFPKWLSRLVFQNIT